MDLCEMCGHAEQAWTQHTTLVPESQRKQQLWRGEIRLQQAIPLEIKLERKLGVNPGWSHKGEWAHISPVGEKGAHFSLIFPPPTTVPGNQLKEGRHHFGHKQQLLKLWCTSPTTGKGEMPSCQQ